HFRDRRHTGQTGNQRREAGIGSDLCRQQRLNLRFRRCGGGDTLLQGRLSCQTVLCNLRLSLRDIQPTGNERRLGAERGSIEQALLGGQRRLSGEVVLQSVSDIAAGVGRRLIDQIKAQLKRRAGSRLRRGIWLNEHAGFSARRADFNRVLCLCNPSLKIANGRNSSLRRLSQRSRQRVLRLNGSRRRLSRQRRERAAARQASSKSAFDTFRGDAGDGGFQIERHARRRLFERDCGQQRFVVKALGSQSNLRGKHRLLENRHLRLIG